MNQWNQENVGWVAIDIDGAYRWIHKYNIYIIQTKKEGNPIIMTAEIQLALY